jgi:hypothetical protein
VQLRARAWDGGDLRSGSCRGPPARRTRDLFPLAVAGPSGRLPLRVRREPEIGLAPAPPNVASGGAPWRCLSTDRGSRTLSAARRRPSMRTSEGACRPPAAARRIGGLLAETVNPRGAGNTRLPEGGGASACRTCRPRAARRRGSSSRPRLAAGDGARSGGRRSAREALTGREIAPRACPVLARVRLREAPRC